MADDAETGDALSQHIEIIEEAYEFMLAYAAQGREREEDPGATTGIRSFLERARDALDDIAGAASAAAQSRGAGSPADCQPFIDVLAEDARKSQAAIRLVLAQPSINSQTIDNLNASIHLRALLTDLFLVDEGLKPPAS